jgi:protein-S-isoprenylcysteine O-methyltransferase Ste14
MIKDMKQRLEHWGFSWEGLRDNRHGEWWVLAQMALLAAHALPTEPPLSAFGVQWPLVLRLVGAVVVVVGLASGVQGALNLGDSLSPLPEPIPGAPLVTAGAYGRCRHPLYQSLLLCSLGLTLLLGSLLHLALFLALAVVLAHKARREEQRLCALHPDYMAYRQRTAAILPFVPGLDWRRA